MMINLVGVRPRDMNAAAGDGGAKTTCCHYWLIEPPNGSISRGVCKLCKEERVFNNSADRYLIKKVAVHRARLAIAARPK